MKRIAIRQLMITLLMPPIAYAEPEILIGAYQASNQSPGRYSLIAAGAAILGVLISIFAVFIAGRANSTNKKMFKRQGIIDLHMAWLGVNDIDQANLITPDVVRAIGALDLTAALWNHDVIEKGILYQSYWIPYRQLYDVLIGCNAIPPGMTQTCADLVRPPISQAYNSMEKFDLKKEGTSTV